MNDIIENRNTIENENVYYDDECVCGSVSPAYPGQPLVVGSSGSNVSIMQSYLNAIRLGMFPSMTRLTVDGVYGTATRNTVMQYQGLSGLRIDGVIGEQTWNSIVEDYNSLPNTPSDEYPGTVLRPGSTGADVRNMQLKLNGVNPVYTAINYQTVDGVFGVDMSNAVKRFQSQFGLTADGLIGPLTWDKIVSVNRGVNTDNNTNVTTQYPGAILTVGSRGNSVRFVQSYMNSINNYYNYRWPTLVIDGIYGQQTRQVVTAFQNKYNLTPDGIVGPNTWRKMIPEFNGVI